MSSLDAVRLGLPPAARPSTGRAAPAMPLRIRPRADLKALPPGTAARAAKSADENTHRSLLDQIGGALKGVVPGAIQLGISAGKAVAAPVRAAIDVAKGDENIGDVALPAITNVLIPAAPVLRRALHAGSDEQKAYDAKYAGLQTEMVDSLVRTGGNLIHPSRYGKAIRNGRIVDTVLEDAGNIALVGGAVGKLLGSGATAAAAAGNAERAATLGKWANAAERVAKVGGGIGDAPVSVFRKGIEAAGKGAASVVDGWAGMPAESWQARLAAKAPLLTSEEGRFLKSGARQIGRDATRAESAVKRRLYRTVQDLGISVPEQGVVTAVRTGLADQLVKLMDDKGMTLEEARQVMISRDIPEQTLTSDVAQLAVDYVKGSMPAEQMAKIDKYGNVVDELMGEQTARALAGTGRVSGPLDPAHLGNDPITDKVNAELERAMADNPTADPNALLQDILDNPQSWPARWRPAMRSAGLVRQELGDPTYPLRPNEMLDAGLPAPDYLPGGRSDLINPTSQGTGRVPTREGIRGYQGLASEQARVTSEVQPFSARALGEKAGREARVTTGNEGIHQLFNDNRIKMVKDVVPASRLDELRIEAERQAKAQRGTPRQIADATAELFGQMILDELASKGLDVIPGSRSAPALGDFDPASKVKFSMTNADSVVLPAGVKDRLIPYMTGREMGKFWNAVAKINTKFKGVVLPFSLRWQLGDVVGGTFMSWVGGGIPPWDLIDGMRQIKTVGERGTTAIFDNPAFEDAGLNFEESRWMTNAEDLPAPATKAGKAWRKAGDVRRGSFRVNAAINRINRQGYVLARLQKLLDERGISLDLADENPAAWQDPDIQRAITDAVDDANKVMGAFDEMSPFERRYVRNAFPFWAWNKHITQLAWNTAIDNPARMMWTMRLGTYGQDPNDPMNDLPWMQGGIPVGDKIIPTNFVNPFNDIGDGSIYTPTGAARALSPALKFAAAAVGKDANRGFADITRPYDGGGLDALGRPGGFRLLSPTELAYQAIKQTPQGRGLLNVLPTSSVGDIGLGPHPRYGNGDFIVNRSGRPIDTTSRWQPLFGLAGIGGTDDALPLVSDRADIKPIIDAKNAREREARRRARNTITFGD